MLESDVVLAEVQGSPYWTQHALDCSFRTRTKLTGTRRMLDKYQITNTFCCDNARNALDRQRNDKENRYTQPVTHPVHVLCSSITPQVVFQQT